MSNKNCPFCNSPHIDTSNAICTCTKCGASANCNSWNNRPHTKILKTSIDELIKGIDFVLNNQYTHRMNERKLKQVRDYAIKIIRGNE